MDVNIIRYPHIFLLCCVITLCFPNYAKANEESTCQKEQIRFNICDSPCVAQVGLKILRATFNNFLINSECVERASIIYWLTNSSKNSALEVTLDNNDVWKQDCTFSRQIKSNLPTKTPESRVRQNKGVYNLQKEASFRTVSNDKYTYLHGLTIGGRYSMQFKIKLSQGIDGRTEFFSRQERITLSIDGVFKEDGMVGNVNQGSCCKVRSTQYILDVLNGECKIQKSTKREDYNINTFLLSLLIFLLLAFVVLNMIFHLRKLIIDRRWYQSRRTDSAQVSFKNFNPEEIHPDILLSSRHNTMPHRNHQSTLMKNSTITIRLLPHGEELLIEELKSRLSRQSI